jgi:hypothetical protein
MTYPAGIKVTDDELAAVNITRHEFHGEWNPKGQRLAALVCERRLSLI